MKNKLSIFLHTLAFSLLFSASTFSSYATHIIGGSLTYTHLYFNVYSITLTLYGDCSSSSHTCFNTLPTAEPGICVYDGDTLINTVNLTIQAPDSGAEVTTCAGDSTQCTDPTSTMPGEKKYVYYGTIDLFYPSSKWRFAFTGYMGSSCSAANTATITNLEYGATIQLIDTLNDSSYYNNSVTLAHLGLNK